LLRFYLLKLFVVFVILCGLRIFGFNILAGRPRLASLVKGGMEWLVNEEYVSTSRTGQHALFSIFLLGNLAKFTIEGKVVNWKSRLWSIRQIFADCNVAFGDCESPLESKQSQLVSWSCPAYGIVGINTDGSSLGNPERQGQEVWFGIAMAYGGPIDDTN
jgi:hypothetical protein